MLYMKKKKERNRKLHMKTVLKSYCVLTLCILTFFVSTIVMAESELPSLEIA